MKVLEIGHLMPILFPLFEGQSLRDPLRQVRLFNCGGRRHGNSSFCTHSNSENSLRQYPCARMTSEALPNSGTAVCRFATCPSLMYLKYLY